MISLLLLCDQHDIHAVKKCIEQVIANTTNLDAIEFIITADSLDKTKLFKESLVGEYPVRMIVKSQGSYSLMNSQREIFNFGFLQIHADSILVLPIFSNQIKFAKNWDCNLRELYQKQSNKLGHDIFVIQLADSYCYTTHWLDVSSGFGATNDFGGWREYLLNFLEDKLQERFAYTSLASICMGNIPGYAIKEPLPVTELNESVAKSMYRYIANNDKKQKAYNQLNKMDLIDLCGYLAKLPEFLKVYSFLLHRHIAEASRSIIQGHTFPLLDVFFVSILYQRKLIDARSISQEWWPFIDNWHIKELPKINNN